MLIRVRGPEVEPVVHVAGIGRDATLLDECRAIRRGRLRVRHVEEARDAAADRGERLAAERGFVREPRLATVHLTVDDPGQQVTAREIDDFRVGRYGSGSDALDALATNQHVGREDLPVAHDLAVDQRQHRHCTLAPRRTRSVAVTSSAVMPGS